MIRNYTSQFEIASSDPNFPARLTIFDKAGESCYISRHKHRDIEINYLIRGCLKSIVNGKETIINQGEYCLINSNDIHSTDYVQPNEQIKFLVVSISYSFIKNYMPDFDNYRFEITDAEIQHNIGRIVRHIAELMEKNEKLAELYILSSLVKILEILFTSCMVERSKVEIEYNKIPMYDYRRMAMLYVNDHFSEQITLKNISEYVGLSETYFAKFFKIKTHKTFMQYLNEVRLVHTIMDMENSDINETVAATKNGFPNVKTFIRTFKSVYKCTPTEYRKQYKCWLTVYVFDKFHDYNYYL